VRAKATQRVSEEQASHPAQPRKGPTKKQRRTEEKPGSRDVNLRKKKQEEKTLSHRQFLTTFRTPMTLAASFAPLSLEERTMLSKIMTKLLDRPLDDADHR
jgi:hypothetical protein